MKQTANFYDFERAFETMNRDENFSYEGKRALFDWLEEYEQDSGEEMELDVIALCCDFTEYANLAEFQREYGDEYETLDDIRDETTVIDVDIETDEDGNENGSFIIQVF